MAKDERIEVAGSKINDATAVENDDARYDVIENVKLEQVGVNVRTYIYSLSSHTYQRWCWGITIFIVQIAWLIVCVLFTSLYHGYHTSGTTIVLFALPISEKCTCCHSIYDVVNVD